jgi:hypothetical protein
VGDWATYNGSVWQRVEGGADLEGVNLNVSGTTNLAALTASTALALDASKNVVSVTNTGTGNNVLGTSPTMATPTLTGDVQMSTGNLVVGTSGKGIDFSTTPGTGTSELLAVYEEGTWTPVITSVSIDATMGANNAGFYTKVGRVVTCTMYIETTNLNGITGAFYIKGWPFAIGQNGGAFCSQASGLAITAGQSVTLRPWASALMRFSKWDATTGTTEMNATAWTDDGAGFFSVSYMV